MQTRLRSATPADAQTIAALAIQVFLDTYATEGVRPDLAGEAFVEYAPAAFAERLVDSARRFVLAEQDTALVGFAEWITTSLPAPAGSLSGVQLVRLYIQPRFQRSGLGKRLLLATEAAASSLGRSALWLTTWDGNHRARAFYAAVGYEDVGATSYSYEDRVYANRVFAKSLGAGRGAA